METTNSKSVEIVQQILEEYKKDLIPQSDSVKEIAQYVKMSRNELEKLTPEQCAIMNHRFIQYATYMQKLYNIERARLNQTQKWLLKAVAPLLDNYDKYVKFDIKVELIARENSYVNDLNKVMEGAQHRLDKLTFMADCMKDQGASLKNIQYVKLALAKEN